MLLSSASEGSSLILSPRDACLQEVRESGVALVPTKKATDSAWHLKGILEGQTELASLKECHSRLWAEGTWD